jgi:hypothetical protein
VVVIRISGYQVIRRFTIHSAELRACPELVEGTGFLFTIADFFFFGVNLRSSAVNKVEKTKPIAGLWPEILDPNI